MLSHPGAKKDNLFIIKKKSYHVLQHIIIVSAYYHYIFTGNLNKNEPRPHTLYQAIRFRTSRELFAYRYSIPIPFPT